MTRDDINVILGSYQGIPPVIAKLPCGYHGKDYIKDEDTLIDAIRNIIKINVEADRKRIMKEITEGNFWHEKR